MHEFSQMAALSVESEAGGSGIFLKSIVPQV
jgi:hypothetical protein